MSGAKHKKSITFVSHLSLPLLQGSSVAGPGGAERQFFLFGKGLANRGWSVCFISDDHAADRNLPTIMPVELAGFSFMHGNKRRFLLDWLSILHAMWRADSQYYVVKTPAYLLAPMYVFTLLFRRKLVFWAQMEFDAWPALRPKKKLLGLLQTFGTRHADIILAQNRSQVAGFRRNFGKDAVLIRNIAGDLAGPGRAAADDERVDVLWVGNSSVKKRYEIVVALARLLPQHSFAVAMCVSDPARYTQAEAQCAALGNVRFLGAVPPVAMESWYSRARVLLNTSMQEGFPNAYLQAWQRGVPVASVCIDPDGVVTENGLGIVADRKLTAAVQDDAENYAQVLRPHVERLLTDADYYRSFARNAQDYVAGNHSEAALVDLLESALLRAST